MLNIVDFEHVSVLSIFGQFDHWPHRTVYLLLDPALRGPVPAPPPTSPMVAARPPFPGSATAAPSVALADVSRPPGVLPNMTSQREHRVKAGC